jgi:Fur family ferric uptake transcriptional regulator/Fur family peroxide stress response transcriptional regulator
MNEIEGLKLTKQRQTVLQVVLESDKHLTANEVFDDARQLLPGISFATVYNSLNYLKSKRLIGEIKFGTNANLYDRKLTRHDHALCNNCGKLVDLELTIPNKLLEEAASRSKFKPETIELTLRGLCPECSEQEM